MANETPKNLAHLGERAKDFLTKPDHVYVHNNRPYDLRTIELRTAEALANDPRCKFLQWADADRRPKDQEGKQLQQQPMPTAPAGSPKSKP